MTDSQARASGKVPKSKLLYILLTSVSYTVAYYALVPYTLYNLGINFRLIHFREDNSDFCLD